MTKGEMEKDVVNSHSVSAKQLRASALLGLRVQSKQLKRGH